MSESIVISCQVRNLLTAEDVWRGVQLVMSEFVDTDKALYRTTVQDERVSVSFSEIGCDLIKQNGSNAFFITQGDVGIRQLISYSEIDGGLQMAFSYEDLFVSVKELIFYLSGVLFCVNIVCGCKSYKAKFRQMISPPNTNLHRCPALSNRRNGYIEGVSADMWFGDSFWQYAACTKQDVLDCSWLKCEERDNHLYVQAWPQPFSSAEGEQGEIQRKLLKLLFNIDENRPHGGDPEEQPRIFSQSVVINEQGSVVGQSPLREDSGPPPLPKMPPPLPPNRSSHDD